jgi:hypothetical protein
MEKFSFFALGLGLALLIIGFIERGKTERSRWMRPLAIVLLIIGAATSVFVQDFIAGFTEAFWRK